MEKYNNLTLEELYIELEKVKENLVILANQDYKIKNKINKLYRTKRKNDKSLKENNEDYEILTELINR